MTTQINVQFSDSTQAKISSYFGAPQDPTAYPNQGTIETSDSRWAAFYNSVPAESQSGLPVPSGN